jgi:ribosomal protein S3AE
MEGEQEQRPSADITDATATRLQNEADAYRNIKLRIEDVQGRNCLTNFYVSTQ